MGSIPIDSKLVDNMTITLFIFGVLLADWQARHLLAERQAGNLLETHDDRALIVADILSLWASLYDPYWLIGKGISNLQVGIFQVFKFTFSFERPSQAPSMVTQGVCPTYRHLAEPINKSPRFIFIVWRIHIEDPIWDESQADSAGSTTTMSLPRSDTDFFEHLDWLLRCSEIDAGTGRKYTHLIIQQILADLVEIWRSMIFKIWDFDFLDRGFHYPLLSSIALLAHRILWRELSTIQSVVSNYRWIGFDETMSDAGLWRQPMWRTCPSCIPLQYSGVRCIDVVVLSFISTISSFISVVWRFADWQNVSSCCATPSLDFARPKRWMSHKRHLATIWIVHINYTVTNTMLRVIKSAYHRCGWLLWSCKIVNWRASG